MAKIISIIVIVVTFLARAGYADDQLIEVNLGKVRAGTIAEQTVVIGRSIHNIVIPCECLKLKALSKPGENPTSLDIQFDSRGYKGNVSHEIILVDDQENIITTRLSADVE